MVILILKSPSELCTTSITSDDILCKVIPKANGELLLPQAYSKPSRRRGGDFQVLLRLLDIGGESKNESLTLLR